MARLLLYLVVLLLLMVAAGHAAKYAGDAFALGVGGRGLAMGGAVIAGPFDGTAAYWNPAGMTRLQQRSITAMHAETFGSLLNHDFVAYVDARPRPGAFVQAFGFYLYYLGGGGIKLTQLNQFERPYVVREESHGDYLFAASLAGRISERLDFGLTARVIHRDIGTETGQGLTLDASLLWAVHKNVDLALVLTDATTGFIRYSGKTFDSGADFESIYPTLKPGISIRRTVATDWLVTASASGDIKFENLRGAAQYHAGGMSLDTHYGAEVTYRRVIFGRAGFDWGRFTAGGGIAVRRISVDFAFLHHSDLDETFRVSAGYSF